MNWIRFNKYYNCAYCTSKIYYFFKNIITDIPPCKNKFLGDGTPHPQHHQWIQDVALYYIASYSYLLVSRVSLVHSTVFMRRKWQLCMCGEIRGEGADEIRTQVVIGDASETHENTGVNGNASWLATCDHRKCILIPSGNRASLSLDFWDIL